MLDGLIDRAHGKRLRVIGGGMQGIGVELGTRRRGLADDGERARRCGRGKKVLVGRRCGGDWEMEWAAVCSIGDVVRDERVFNCGLFLITTSYMVVSLWVIIVIFYHHRFINWWLAYHLLVVMFYHLCAWIIYG